MGSAASPVSIWLVLMSPEPAESSVLPRQVSFLMLGSVAFISFNSSCRLQAGDDADGDGGGDALGQQHHHQADDGHEHGVPGLPPARPLSLGALGHQHEPRPDDGEKAEARPRVGHARQHRVEGADHLRFGVVRRGGDGCQCRAGGRQEAG